MTYSSLQVRLSRDQWKLSNLTGVALIRCPLKCDFLIFIEIVKLMRRILLLKIERKWNMKRNKMTFCRLIKRQGTYYKRCIFKELYASYIYLHHLYVYHIHCFHDYSVKGK